MAIEFTRDLIKIDEVVGEQLSQALVEADIIVPEAKPDIAKILDVLGRVVINSKEAIQDKVMVEGTIKYNILYVADGDNQYLDSMDVETSFTHYIDMPDIKPKMVPYVNIYVEHLDYDIINSRKISIKAVLDVNAKVNQELQLEAIKDFKDEEKVQALKDDIMISTSQGQGVSQAVIREDVVLDDDMPSIHRILREKVQTTIDDKRTADNKIVVNGTIDVGILYLCEEDSRPINYFDCQIEFGHFVDIPGAYQGMDCDANVTVEDVYVEAREDINGELRIIGIEVLLSVEGEVFEIENKRIVTDAYSPQTRLQLKKRSVKLVESMGEGQSQTVVKESISFPQGMPEADEVMHVSVQPIISDEEIREGQVIIEGILASNIIYRSGEMGGVVGNFQEDIPFRQAVEINGINEDMYSKSSLQVEDVKFVLLSPDEMELKVNIAARSEVWTISEKEILLGFEEVEDKEPNEGGIFIYFVKPRDNMWNIAKRYNTTIENILKYNDIEDEDHLEVGSRIIIYKKFDYQVSAQ
ncbi:DUF3794 and LysM peptidoglycan-binding domain-containing protein [Xylanivirga thermophila]|uniref:DUF3794 and LysM peptidoglycan-binding domain-containing protein n=1 Tax=Xylanivirga thermophila TaxID=2496273 RepID=UPI00101BE765|nr:SPOCS domain-containing protein [Xylanivirga thermophila]